MKVMYICPGAYAQSDGIYQKVLKTTDYWTQSGAETRVVTYNDMQVSSLEKLLLRFPITYIKNILYYFLFGRRVRSLINQFDPDIIYTRHFICPHFFGKPKKRTLILEVNGDILAETKNQDWKTRRLVQRSLDYYNKYASGLVLTGRGIDSAFPKVKEKVVVPNSILATSKEVLENFNTRNKLAEKVEAHQAISFVATKNRPFYDIEFVVEMVARLKQPHKLWVIGNIKPKSVKNRNKAEVVFLGPKHGDEYRQLLRESKVAITSMNFHAGSKASPLKTRSYLELGVPVFGTDFDCDLTNATPFFRAVKNEGQKNLELYSDALQKFIEEPAVQDFPKIERLPEEVERICLDHREPVRLNFFKQLRKS